MPEFRAVRRAYFGGKVREIGDVVTMDCDAAAAGSAWAPVDHPAIDTSAAKTPEELFGPAVPRAPRPKSAKPPETKAPAA